MFLPDPKELQRTYEENATAAASVLGSTRPTTYIVIAIMGEVAMAIFIAGQANDGGSGSGFPGWAIGLLAIDVAGASIALTIFAFRKGKELASLRPKRPSGLTAPCRRPGVG
jgi:hypothetical protein